MAREGLVGRLVGLSERVQALAFSPDGKSLAVAGGSPGRFGEIQVWDVAKKKLRYSVSITYDTLKIQIRNSSGTVLTTLANYSNLSAKAGYAQVSFDLTAYQGQTIQIYLEGVEDSGLKTSFVVDDFQLNVTTP